MGAKKRNPGYNERRLLTPMQRFLSFCRFEPDTGCVVWIGGQSRGRGHHIPYGVFWADGARHFAHRWAARNIHGIDIDTHQVDHYCPNIIKPNTLCVEHVQALSPVDNRVLQTERNRRFIHLQVGLLSYYDVYGWDPDEPDIEDRIPFYEPPSWLKQGSIDGDCPF